MSELEHKITFSPGFDKRDDDPAKNYGISAVQIFFYVIGKHGAIQWAIGTNWYQQTAREHLARFPSTRPEALRPTGWDLGYHSRKPMYDDHTPIKSCHIIDDGECYYDGSSLNADLLIEGFITGGLDWLWPKLEAEYRFRFEDGPLPDFYGSAE